MAGCLVDASFNSGLSVLGVPLRQGVLSGVHGPLHQNGLGPIVRVDAQTPPQTTEYRISGGTT